MVKYHMPLNKYLFFNYSGSSAKKSIVRIESESKNEPGRDSRGSVSREKSGR